MKVVIKKSVALMLASTVICLSSSAFQAAHACTGDYCAFNFIRDAYMDYYRNIYRFFRIAYRFQRIPIGNLRGDYPYLRPGADPEPEIRLIGTARALIGFDALNALSLVPPKLRHFYNVTMRGFLRNPTFNSFLTFASFSDQWNPLLSDYSRFTVSAFDERRLSLELMFKNYLPTLDSFSEYFESMDEPMDQQTQQFYDQVRLQLPGLSFASPQYRPYLMRDPENRVIGFRIPPQYIAKVKRNPFRMQYGEIKRMYWETSNWCNSTLELLRYRVRSHLRNRGPYTYVVHSNQYYFRELEENVRDIMCNSPDYGPSEISEVPFVALARTWDWNFDYFPPYISANRGYRGL